MNEQFKRLTVVEAVDETSFAAIKPKSPFNNRVGHTIVIGKSGAGKSTLLKTLIELIVPRT